MGEKGIDKIFSYLDEIRNLSIYDKISIDFYGPIDTSIQSWFLEQISKHN